MEPTLYMRSPWWYGRSMLDHTNSATSSVVATFVLSPTVLPASTTSRSLLHLQFQLAGYLLPSTSMHQYPGCRILLRRTSNLAPLSSQGMKACRSGALALEEVLFRQGGMNRELTTLHKFKSRPAVCEAEMARVGLELKGSRSFES